MERVNINVKIWKSCDEAIIPQYAKDGDAGMDLTAVSYEYDEKLQCHIYHTGLHMAIPEGFVGLIYLRSSNRKTNAYMTNHVGVIDSGYRGEILVCFKNRDEKNNYSMPYKPGDRIAQIIIMPYPKITFNEVIVKTDLGKTERGDGGHGSTGK